MSEPDPLVTEIQRRIDASGINLVVVKCTSTVPFEVSVNGLGSVEARQVAGSTFALADTGFAIWSPPRPPLCFKVT